MDAGDDPHLAGLFRGDPGHRLTVGRGRAAVEVDDDLMAVRGEDVRQAADRVRLVVREDDESEIHGRRCRRFAHFQQPEVMMFASSSECVPSYFRETAEWSV
jgi:hypothetical protein